MLIHCTMEELVAIRNGDGSSAALRHLDDCDECRDALDRVHQRVASLKALPAPRAPRDRWPEIRRTVLSERRHERKRLWGFTSLAAAASLVLGLGLVEMVPRLNGADEEEAQFVTLVQEAQTMEELLRGFRPEQRVLNGRIASAVMAVEDQLMLLDTRMYEARRARVATEDMIRLMQQRILLMDQLMKIHATKSTYVGF